MATTASVQPPAINLEKLSFSSQNIFKALHKTRIADVIEHRSSVMPAGKQEPYKLLDTHEDVRVGDVLKMLSDNGILASPVYRLGRDNVKNYLGIISVYDILAWTVFQRVFDDLDTYMNEFEKQQAQPAEAQKDMSEKYLEILKEQSQYFNTKIRDVLGATFESSDSWTLYASDPISSMLQIMTSASYHRVLIIDDTLSPVEAAKISRVTMLTQTDLLRYLRDKGMLFHKQDFEKLLKTPLVQVEELALRRRDTDPNQLDAKTIRRRVIKVPNKFSALSALRVLYNHRVSAVAIVDEKSELVANLSASDLRGITNENLENLMMPVYEFLEKGVKRHTGQPASDQLRVLKNEKCAQDAIETMFDSRIHRVWIVNDNDVPTGVVTMSDLLSLFVPSKETAAEE